MNIFVPAVNTYTCWLHLTLLFLDNSPSHPKDLENFGRGLSKNKGEMANHLISIAAIKDFFVKWKEVQIFANNKQSSSFSVGLE